MNPTSTLAELGMDSLMGAEIKQTLERSFDMVYSVGEIRNLTMGKLIEIQGGGASSPAAAASPKSPLKKAISEKELTKLQVIKYRIFFLPKFVL